MTPLLFVAVIGIISYLVFKLILRVRKLPPGPIPLPLIGNLLALAFSNSPNQLFWEYREKYGEVFTVWLGEKPNVIVTGYEATYEALIKKRNYFSGRPKMILFDILMNGSDIILTDYGDEWDCLRKVGHSAVRKYANGYKLAKLISDIVEDVADQMLREKTLEPNEYIYLMVYNTLASAAFGTTYSKSSPEFIRLKENSEKLRKLVAKGFIPDLISFTRPFFRAQEKAIREVTMDTQEYFREKLREHEDTYQSGVIRDFTDAILASREEALRENKDSIQYLTEDNLKMTIGDLFTAGGDTTQATVRWVLLYIANKRYVQEKIIEEITTSIGHRVAVQEDRLGCPYTWAVISETLRLRSPNPMGFPRKTTRNCQIGNYKIPEGTTVFFNGETIHKNPKNWPEPEEFQPERFLEDGRYLTKQIPNYIPFGLGTRSCIGEQLARNCIFLIIVNLLRRCRVELAKGDGSADLKPKDAALVCEPKDHTIIVTKREI